MPLTELQKKREGKTPYVHFDKIKKIDGKLHYMAETTNNAGTHTIYLDKKLVDAGKL